MRTSLIRRRMAVPMTRVVTEHEDTQYGVRDTRRAVPDGELSGDIELTVDIEKLLQLLGPKALYSKRGKAQLQGGAVEARRVGQTIYYPPGA